MKRLGFWTGLAALFMVAGMLSVVYRFVFGLGAATNLSDLHPWGLWVGFDVIAGVGLASGGFTLAALVYVFDIRKFAPVTKPAILTAFLGYLLVITSLLVDLGKPYNIWRPLVSGNHHSALFEVAMCVMTYTTVLFVEFSPNIFDKLGHHRLSRAIHRFILPVIILGVLLSTLHQSSLGSLYLITPVRMNPIWYSPMLPVIFFLSAVTVGVAMVIFESHLSARAFEKQLELSLTAELGRVLLFLLTLLLTFRLWDMVKHGVFRYLQGFSYVTSMWWLEMLLCFAVPMFLLRNERLRHHPGHLFYAAATHILGFILNRLNVSMTAFQQPGIPPYTPSLMEFAVTGAVISFHFVAFALAVKYLDIFPEVSIKEKVGVLRPRKPVSS